MSDISQSQNDPHVRQPFPDDDLPPYLIRRRQRAGRRSFLSRSVGIVAALVAPCLAGSAVAGANENSAATPDLPVYLNRGDWGAEEALRWDSDDNEVFPPAFYRMRAITIHHSGNWTPAVESDAASLMRSIYEEHTVNRGYGDIGYQLGIGPEGYVYEGRWSGGTSFPVYDVEPSSGRVPRVVQGAHAMGYNAGNVGIVMLGDYTYETPTDAAWWALTTVVAMLAGNSGADPRVRIRYENPINGNMANVPTVSVHGQWTDTECPGQDVRSELPWLRSAAADWIDNYGSGHWFR